MTEYKSALGIRGDRLYCPLPVYIDPYWTCEPNCAHCFARRLNRTWGNDFRAANPERVIKRLSNPRGGSPLSTALKKRKTIKLGSRTDPYQPCEETYLVSTKILSFLMKEKWDVAILTRFVSRLWRLSNERLDSNVTVMCPITVGLEKDWEILERKRTEPVKNRLKTVQKMRNSGVSVAANGEPFIPGYHTVEMFEHTLKVLRSYGIRRYNIYNLHLNDWVAKNLHFLGIDIEKVWYYNQDFNWKPILRKLLSLAEKYDMIIGCPDFVNSGPEWRERANTCCGIDVKNPCTFNTHCFKKAVQEGKDPLLCWDGVGDFAEGKTIINGTNKKMYTLNDAGL